MSIQDLFNKPIFWEVRIRGFNQATLTREDKSFYRKQVSKQFKPAYKTEAAAKAAISRDGNLKHLDLVASPVMFMS